MTADGGDDRSSSGSERGVSQVVAIVLLVAIVALLVGFLGTQLTGYGGELRDPAPRLSPKVLYDDAYEDVGQRLVVIYKSGDRVDLQDVRVQVEGARVYDPGTGSYSRASYESGAFQRQVGRYFTAPERFRLNKTVFTGAGGSSIGSGEYLDLSEATIRFIWSTDGGSRTEIVFEWNGPDA